MKNPSFLKILLLLGFLAGTMVLSAQSGKESWFPLPDKHNMKGERRLLIRNPGDYKLVPITSKSRIRIRTFQGTTFSGKVEKIVADSVFISDTVILTSNIDSLYFISKFLDLSFYDGQKKLIYASGNPQWQIIIPPDSIYKKFGGWDRYKGNLEKKIKIEVIQNRNPLIYANFIKYNVSKLFRLEIAFSYERKIAPKTTWETEFGIFFPTKNFNPLHSYSYSYLLYNGFSVTTNPKIFFLTPRTYLGPVFMYRYLWGTDIRTEWPGKDGNGDLQDQYRNDFGLSARIGGMFRFDQFVVDLYFGAGIKIIRLHQLVYAAYRYHDSNEKLYYNPDHSPVVQNQLLLEPVINLGIKIGCAF